MADYGNGSSTLKSLTNGKPPRSRMTDAQAVIDWVLRVQDSDDIRSKQRSYCDGIVDGNPPFNPATLRKNNAAGRCNVNWGTGKAYLDTAAGSFYDLTSQAPGTVQILQYHGNSENQTEWSRTMSEEADKVFAKNRSWKTHNQVSINETVLHGTGPLFFSNHHQSFPKSIEAGMFLLPDRTGCDPDDWEIGTVLFDYYPPKLYEFIAGGSASAVGWDVEYTKLVIEHAIDQKQPEQRTQNWEWFQNELKSKSFEYFNQTLVCKLAHVWWREFDNRITHVIVERPGAGSCKEPRFLFRNVGLYDNFYQAVHPMYYDVGRGGFHHTVTGLGVKMGQGMAYENRLLCRLMDGAFAPKMFFRPTTAEAREKFQLATFSDWGLLPPNTDYVQAPIQGFLNDGLAMYRTSSDLMRSNLSQYRQPVQPDKPGNPETKFEVGLKASQSGSLSNTVYERYYEQRDALYAEIVRRLCNLNSTDKWAKEYQKNCLDRGVPKECFGCVESVVAVRVTGQGSPFLRREALGALAPFIMRSSEEGQKNWYSDYIASLCGQSAIRRYNPVSQVSQGSSDQKERAGNQVTGMKIGKPADLSPSQDPLIFSGVFLQAASGAVESLQKGADQMQVLSFLNLVGPAIAKHIKRMEGDPLRKEVAAHFEQQLKRLGAITDQLKKRVAADAQKKKAQAQKTQAVLTDQQLKMLETKSKIQDRAIKTRASLIDKAVKSRQGRAIADANAASQIAISHYRALQE